MWDYQTKSCVQTLRGHTRNVCAVCYHPELPVIITGSEDGTVRIWHSNTYSQEHTLNYGMNRVWALGYRPGSNSIAVAYDDGAIVIKVCVLRGRQSARRDAAKARCGEAAAVACKSQPQKSSCSHAHTRPRIPHTHTHTHTNTHTRTTHTHTHFLYSWLTERHSLCR